MARKGAKSSASTEIEIFGRIYHVRGRDDGEYLQGLARVVDEKMREISRHVATVDTAKIAILAALNLADELSQCQMQLEGERVEIKEKVTALTADLANALKG